MTLTRFSEVKMILENADTIFSLVFITCFHELIQELSWMAHIHLGQIVSVCVKAHLNLVIFFFSEPLHVSLRQTACWSSYKKDKCIGRYSPDCMKENRNCIPANDSHCLHHFSSERESEGKTHDCTFSTLNTNLDNGSLVYKSNKHWLRYYHKSIIIWNQKWWLWELCYSSFFLSL